MRVWMLLITMLATIATTLPAQAARSLAVLPFDQGAKSEEYEGLGRALAGMMVSDLTRVEDLELVERTRLDAILSEIELGEGGYLDPKTAVKLGNGVGAEWVVVGTWSVVKTAFLLDARTVDVKSGKIIAAVDAQGEIDDFITVEKTLIEDLLAELEVAVSAGARRKIIASAATEDFQAMTTYAAGLQAEFDGDYEKAKKKYQEAAQRDPEFDLPAQRIADVNSQLETLEANRVQKKADEKTQRLLDALAKSPDEMTLTGRTNDPKIMGQLALRWGILEYFDRHCQAVKEMNHYLERHNGKPKDLEGPSSYNHKHWAAFDLGLYDKRPEIWNHGAVSPGNNRYRYLVDDAPAYSFAPQMIVGITDGIERAEDIGSSLLNYTVTCAGREPAAQVQALEELMAMTKRLGIADQTTYSNNKRPVWTEIEIYLLQAMAMRDGMTAKVKARSEALMNLKTGKEDDDYAIRSDVGRITRTADRAQRFVTARDGQSEAWVRKITKAAADKDANVLALQSKACAQLVSMSERTHARLVEQEANENRVAQAYWTLIDAAIGATSLKMAGCVLGIPAELKTQAEALAWVDTLPNRLRTGRPESCEKTLAELPDRTNSYRKAYEGTEDLYRALLLSTGMSVVRQGCAEIR